MATDNVTDGRLTHGEAIAGYVSTLNRQLTREELQTLAWNAKESAYLNGVVMRTAQSPDNSERVQYAPFSLFPSFVPRSLLSQVQGVQKDFNRLMHKVAHDREFLYRCFKNVLDVDEFTKKLWDIYCQVDKEGLAQPICLGLFRNDYMMDVKQQSSSSADSAIPKTIQMKQIEFNTIASSFAGLVSNLSNVHRYSLTQAGVKFDNTQVPDNDPIQGLADGMVSAWQLYGNESAIILFLVSDGERNTFDQRWLENKIFKRNTSLFVLYRTMTDMVERAELSKDKVLNIDGHEVAVVYFRAGYSPDTYTSSKHWDARLKIERSKAIKCPNVLYQLAGAKKVQQELCRPGAVEKYITDEESVRDIRDKFAEQFSLDLDDGGNAAVLKAMTEPENYVLKPNREGGGNNLYGAEVKRFLEEVKDSPERAGYIMMERIFPWIQKNCLLKVGQDISIKDVVNEVGIFGVYIGTKDSEIENKEVGCLVRTKTLGTDEGGVSMGYSCLDTPFLIDSS